MRIRIAIALAIAAAAIVAIVAIRCTTSRDDHAQRVHALDVDAYHDQLAARLQREARLHPPITTVVRYERHSYLLNFVPFGAGQFQNGQRRKGWLFLGVETALAAMRAAVVRQNGHIRCSFCTACYQNRREIPATAGAQFALRPDELGLRMTGRWTATAR